MKKTILFFISAAIITGGTAAHAADPGNDRLRFFGAIDYFLRGDVDDEVVDTYNEAVDALGAASADITTSNGIGGRLGIRKRLAGGRFDVGASIGYIIGPRIEVDFRDDTIPPGSIDEKITSSVARLLFEAAGMVPLGDRAFLRLGGAIGVGRTAIEDDFDGSGFYAGSATFKEDKTGFTWEVSPAIVIPASRADLEIGLRYASFPTIDETDNTFKFDWDALGFYIGAAF